VRLEDHGRSVAQQQHGRAPDGPGLAAVQVDDVRVGESAAQPRDRDEVGRVRLPAHPQRRPRDAPLVEPSGQVPDRRADDLDVEAGVASRTREAQAHQGCAAVHGLTHVHDPKGCRLSGHAR